MAVFDMKCPRCLALRLDASMTVIVCAICGDEMEKVLLPGKANAVIGDEIDVEIKNGLCHADGTPRRFRSRSELARAAKEKGLVNRVQHLGRQGSDKSPHTTRWT